MKPLVTATLVLVMAGTLLLAAITTGSVLALFTDADSVAGNIFDTAACFPNANTGLLDPAAEAADTGGDADGFEASPTSAFSDAGGNASNVDGAGDRHRFYNYGFSIDGTCAVSGIEVRLDWWLDSTAGISSMDVELSWDAGTSWTAAKTDATETTTEHTTTLGGSADTWGHAWTVAELSDSNFRVRVVSNSDDVARDFFLDWVPVNVYYGP